MAKYEVKEIKLKPPAEYESHYVFQNLGIGAFLGDTLEKSLELFDSEKIHRKKVVPILIVIENKNDFALRLNERNIFVVLPDGTNIRPIHFTQAFSFVLSKKAKRPTTGARLPRGLGRLRQRNKEMFDDFEHKHFGEKIVAPHESDYGVLFYHLPERDEIGALQLYMPEIENMTSGEELMFVEFDLKTGN